MKARIKIRILRWVYRFLYRLAEAGIADGSDIIYGFVRRYPAPEDLRDEDLPAKVQELAEAIQGAS